MPDRRIPPAPTDEYWSQGDQVLHHKWEAPEHEGPVQHEDPSDYSALGGPESERAYGRTRSDDGSFPFRHGGGAGDRDPYAQYERGGYLKLHGPDYGRNSDGSHSHHGLGPRDYRRADDRVYEDVCEALTHDADVDATEIEVKVSDGEVTLLGTVTTREQKRRAGYIADRMPGVRDVHNQLRIEDRIGPATS